MATGEGSRAAIDKALASVPTRDAKLIAFDDGLWLVLDSPTGKSAMVCLSGVDHGSTVNAIIAEITAELRAQQERSK
jgi:hypothetical protein